MVFEIYCLIIRYIFSENEDKILNSKIFIIKKTEKKENMRNISFRRMLLKKPSQLLKSIKSILSEQFLELIIKSYFRTKKELTLKFNRHKDYSNKLQHNI